MRLQLIILCMFMSGACYCQTGKMEIDSSTAVSLHTIQNIPSKSLDFIDKKYSKLSNDVQKQSEKLLKRMQDKEAKLQKKLQGTDSLKAKELFETSKAKYEALQNKIVSPVNTATAKLKEYIPGLDSTNTALKFLSQANGLQDMTTDKLTQLSSVTNSVQELQGRLQQANEIQSFIRERETQLKESLANTGLGKALLNLNKEVFYYQQRLTEYKELLNDKKKLEEKLISTVRTLPAFQSFWQKHSYLAQLFRMPDNSNSTAQAIPGLQTTASIQQELQQRFGTQISMPNTNRGTGGNLFQQQLGQAQAQLNALKDKINQSGGGGNSDMTMPDFKSPNSQRTKKFLNRFQLGFNIQSEKGTAYLPAMTDMALTLGYRLDDKKIFGVETSYKLGWGNGWNNIKLSSEGIGIRSFADIKFKGSIWISAGFEYNYLQRFSSITEIKNLDIWQCSALAGLTKKYRIAKNRTGSIQLLYDFLASRQVPQGQALKFRLGYTFK